MVDAVLFSAVYSVVLLCLGRWCATEGCDILSQHYGSSFLGAVLLACVAALPDVLFFTTALTRADQNFGVGVLAGSVCVESTVAIGMALALGVAGSKQAPFSLDKSVRAQGQLLLLMVPLLICILIDGYCLSFGLLGFCEFLGYLWFCAGASRVSAKKRETDPGERGGFLFSDDHQPAGKGLLLTFVGLLIFWLFSDDLVMATLLLCTERRMGAHIASFFIGGVACCCGDVVESAILASQGKRDAPNIAVSNAISAVTTKITLLAGILCLNGYFSGASNFRPQGLWVVAFATGLGGAIISLPSAISRWHGLILLCAFMGLAFVQFNSLPTPVYNVGSHKHLGQVAQAVGSVATDSSFRDILDEINLNPYA